MITKLDDSSHTMAYLVPVGHAAEAVTTYLNRYCVGVELYENKIRVRNLGDYIRRTKKGA